MADFLFIEEYGTVVRDNNGVAMQMPGPIVTSQKLVIDTSLSTKTPGDFDPSTTWIQIHADADVYFVIGTGGLIATQEDRFLRSELVRPVWVNSNQFSRIAVIRRTD